MGQPSLAERLGYGAEDRLLIVNCDDLGSSHAANVATFRSMAYGVATSATLMVPCPWAREAARMFRGYPVGVHLTLTCEYRGTLDWMANAAAGVTRSSHSTAPAGSKEAVPMM